MNAVIEQARSIKSRFEQMAVQQPAATLSALDARGKVESEAAKQWEYEHRDHGLLHSVGSAAKRWGLEHPVAATRALATGVIQFGREITSVPQAFFTGDFDRLSRMSPVTIITLNTFGASVNLAGSTAAAVLSVLPIQRSFGALVEERPDEVAPDSCPVYYTGGVGISKEKEKEIAGLLTKQLGVKDPGFKVCVIDLGSSGSGLGGKVADVFRAAGSRLCPALALVGAEPAARKMLWVIRNQPRATFICHSMGNIMLRNAINGAVVLGDGSRLQNVSWIAVAPPLNDSIEIQVHTGKFNRLVSSGDIPEQLLRPEGWPMEEGGASKHDHDARQYVPDVHPDWLMHE
jgi:hypothetical protein